MSDIFISYSREDQLQAEALARILQQQGWSVWWDRTILPGQSFDQAIQKALDSAKCVIVLWSRHSIVSDWVKDEAAEATARNILVPALIEDIPIPLGFRRLQTANLSDWQGISPHPAFDQMLLAVSEKLGSRSASTKRKPSIEVRAQATANTRTQSGTEWRTELLATGLSMRKLRVYLAQDTHILEIHATLWGNYVVLDGERVSKAITDNLPLFEVGDRERRYSAQVLLTTGLVSIKACKLLIAGQILYNEGNPAG